MKRAWRELRGPATTPKGAAFSVALGLFVGSIPAFGLHTPVVVALCLWFRLDGAIAWLASNVSNPLFAPALLTFEAQIGAWLCTGAPLRASGHASRAQAVRHFVAYMFVGAPVAGAGLALVGGAIAYAMVQRRSETAPREPYRLPAEAPPWFAAVERVARRFASPESPLPRERTRFHYLRAKLLADPAARIVASAEGEAPNALGAVVDVGAGRGQLALLLLELGRATTVVGIDWDERKIREAQRAAAACGETGRAVFIRGDARTTPLPVADTVLLVDVLHYFSLEEQDAILDRAAAAVRPGGRVLIRDADTERGWRSAVTLAEERLFTALRFNRGDRVLFRPASQIAGRLEAAGLRCIISPAWRGTPFSNVLVSARRP